MASKIKIKRSAVAGKVPLTTDLELSELAVNTNDGRLYTKKDDGTESIVEIGGPDFGSRNVTTTGTSTAASFIPSSSTVPTNGVYLPAANSVAISTGGSGRLFIDSSGRLLIGKDVTTETTPGVSISSSDSFFTASGPVAFFNRQSTEGEIVYFRQGNVSRGALSFASSLFSIDSDSSFGVKTSGTERLRITPAGLVGIGTSTPSESLTVGSGNVQVNNGQLALGVFGTSGLQLINDGTIGTVNSLPLIFRTGAAERGRFDTSGRLLVGTTTANANGGVLQLSSGITFPATQVAATDANTLDDYEEGTFTPAYGTGVVASGTIIPSGSYTKIGNVVAFFAKLGATGAYTFNPANGTLISGLPFSANVNGLATASPDTHTPILAGSVVGTSVYGSASISSTFWLNVSGTYSIA